MNKFDSMTKEQYCAAKDGFFLQYNPPASKPVETMDLVMRQENALAIIKGDRKMEFRQINDDNFNMLNDEETYTWMMDHRKDEKMDTEAMYEFLCSVPLPRRGKLMVPGCGMHQERPHLRVPQGSGIPPKTLRMP